ncbi:BPI fold-containing family B member 6-like [Gastrophryne carolinensis]
MYRTHISLLEVHVVAEILASDKLMKKMSASQETKKALGKKGKSPVKGITNIKVEKLSFSNIELNFLPDIGIHMFVNNKIEIGGKSFLGGRTELKLDINIITNSTIKKENVTCTTLVRSECKVEILNVKANLPKGILPNVMDAFLAKNLKTLLPSTACPAVDYILSEVQKQMCPQDFHLILYVPFVGVEEKSSSKPSQATIYKGEALIGQPDNASAYQVLPSNPQATTLVLTANFLGYAFTILQEEGAFNLSISEDDITNAGAMSTTVLGDFIPDLPQGLTDYKINIYVDKPPLVTLSSSKALLHLYSTMETSASSPDSETFILFVINLTLKHVPKGSLFTVLI